MINASGAADETGMPVIDAHTHPGDILYPGGGALIHAGRILGLQQYPLPDTS